MRRFILLAITVLLALALTPPVGAQDVVPGTRAHALARTQSLGHDVGRVEIPAIGMNEVIREGIAVQNINRGVSHWAGTAQPGGHGNLVLAGHRTTYTRPFYDLDKLDVGDEVFATGLDGQRVAYRVTRTMIVEPSDVWIANWTETPTLTMFACHPKGSARHRIVVTAELVGAPVALP